MTMAQTTCKIDSVKCITPALPSALHNFLSFSRISLAVP